MFETILSRLRDWLAFHETYAGLQKLDPHIRADLGLEDADLRRLARAAVDHRHGDQISLYALVNEMPAPAPEKSPPVSPRPSCRVPAHPAAQGS